MGVGWLARVIQSTGETTVMGPVLAEPELVRVKLARVSVATITPA